jgi:serine/threonine protein phosphatase PrpC
MPFRVHSHGASDVGLVRTNNEDAWFASPDGRVFLIADGLGGHQAGEVAARESVEWFLSTFLGAFPEKADHPLTNDEISQQLQACFDTTNEQLFALSAQHELLHGMGTTFCSLSVHGDNVAIAHVGDSRVYRHRDGVLEQLTKDHCWTQAAPYVAECEAQTTKGILTKALGTMPSIDPTIQLLPLQSHDTFLLCTDGLSDMLAHDEIESVLNRSMTIGERVRMLIALAKQKGGADNITIILVEVLS